MVGIVQAVQDPPNSGPSALLFGTRVAVPKHKEAALKARKEHLLLLLEAKRAALAEAAEAAERANPPQRAARAPPPPNAVRARAKLELAPPLTTSGARVFGEGADGCVALPELRLPRTSGRTPFLNRLPRPQTADEAAIRSLERDQTRAFRESEGLRVDEFTGIEIALVAGATIRPRTAGALRAARAPVFGARPATAALPAAAAAPLAALVSGDVSWEDVLRRAESAGEDAGRPVTAAVVDLALAVERGRSAAAAVEGDLRRAKRTRFVVSDPASRRKMRKWGAHALYGVLRAFADSLLSASLGRWRAAVGAARRAETLRRFREYQGGKRLAWLWYEALQRQLARAWVSWTSGVAHCIIAEVVARQAAVARLLQALFRTRHARRLVAVYRADRQRRLERASAEAIQKSWRRRAAVKRFRVVLTAHRRETRTLRIQLAWRQKIARRLWLRLVHEKFLYDSATRIECGARAWKAAKRAAYRRRKRDERWAAARIQRVFRGARGRRYAAAYKERLRISRILSRFQAQVRGVSACRRMERFRDIARDYAKLLLTHTIRMQALFRGERARVMTRIRTRGADARKRRDDLFARRIQRCGRAYVAGKVLRALKLERRDRQIARAKEWRAAYNETEKLNVYTNEDTGESATEAPASGYTDADGNLHLESGEVVPNPLLHLSADEKRALKEAQRCAECQDNDASRLCDQCGDQFCASCWAQVHVGPGKRKDHTYVAINRPECAECLVEWALRHCTHCDDYFCMSCFEKIHQGASAKRHTWTKISEFDYA